MPAESSAHAPAKKRGPVFWTVVAVLGLGALLWTGNFVRRLIIFEETDDAAVAGHVHLVSSRLAGTVSESLVSENQSVKAGQVLARLDPLAAQIALQKAQAARDAAQAALAQARTGVTEAGAELAQARAQVAAAAAQVAQARAQQELAEVQQGRSERLFVADTRTISKADVDTSRSAAAASGAGVQAARAAYAASEARVKVAAAAVEASHAQLASAQARVAAEDAAVRDAERELSYAAIAAPVDGRIGNKNVEVGNRVQVGQALYALVESDYWIVANFKETQLRRMQAGQPVEITVDAIGGHDFTGRLESVSPASGAVFALLPPDNATGNFTKVVQRVPVKIVFEADSVRGYEDRLRPGLSAVVSVRVR